MPGIKFDITGDNQHFIDAMNGVQDSVRRTSQMVESAGMSIEGMFNRIAGAAGIAFSAATVQNFANKVKETRMYFQDIESTMEVFLGNQKKAADFTEKLKKYAYYNMFEFSDLAAASKQMIAYHTAVDDVIPELDKLSNIATGTKQPLMELVGMYNNARSVGYIASQQLGMWARQGLLVKETLKEMGQEVKKGGVTFEQLQMVIDKYTGEGGMFHDLMANQMENISAEAGQLADTLDLMYDEIGRKYQDVFVKGYKAASAAAEGFPEMAEPILDAAASGAEFLIDHYKEIGKVLLQLITTYGAYKAALIATTTVEGAINRMNYKNEVEELQFQIQLLNDIKQTKDEISSQDLKQLVDVERLTEEQAKQLEIEREKLAIRVGKGEITEDQANNLSELQTRLALLDQEHQKEMRNADIKIDALRQEKDYRVGILEMAEQEATQAQKKLEDAQKSLKIAEDDMNVKKKALEIAQQDAAKYGTDVDSDAKAEAEEAIAKYKELAEQTDIATLADKANEAQKYRDVVAKEADVAATNLQTATQKRHTLATEVDTVAIEENTLATRMGNIATKAWTKTQQIFAVAVGQVKNAFNGLKAAIMTNPLGVLIGAITIALPLLMDFFSSEEIGAEVTKRFGDTADEAAGDVKSLYGVLNSASSGSQVYEKTVQDLITTCKEYGIVTDAEIEKMQTLGEKVEFVKNKKEELIKAIKAESLERQAAEAIANAQDTYETEIGDIKTKIKNAMSGEWDNETKNVLVDTLLDSSDFEKIAAASNKYRDALKQLREEGASNAEIQRTERELYAEIQGAISEVTDKAKSMAEAHGYSTSAVRSFSNALEDNVIDIQKSQNTLDDTIDKVEQAKGAGIAALDEVTRKNYYAQKSLSDIKDELDKIIQRKNIDIDINISYNEQNPMPEALKNLTAEEWKQRAAYFTSQANSLQMSSWGKKTVVDPNTGQSMLMSRDDAVRQGVLSANQGQKQEKADAAKKKADELAAQEAEKNKKKYEQAARERATRNAKTLQEQWKHEEEMTDLQTKAARAREDASIAAIQNQAQRERAEREAQHQRTVEDLKRQEDDIYKAIYDQRKKQWELTHKNLPYENTEEGRKGWQGVSGTLTNEEQKYFDQRNAIIQANLRQENEVYQRYNLERIRSEVQSMRDYLKEYGTYEQQKLAIAQEYAEKIRQAEASGNQGEVLRLKAEQRKAEGSAKANELARGIDFSQLFDGVGSIVKSIAEETYKRVQEYKGTEEYKTSAPESKKAIADLEARLIEKGGAGSASVFSTKTWDDITAAAQRYDAALKGLEWNTQEHIAAIERQEKAQENYDKVMNDANSTLAERLAAEDRLKTANREAQETAEGKQGAQANVDQAGQELENAAAKGTKGLEDFNTILGQVTSGSLTGFTLAVGNIIKQLTGDGDAAKSVGELFGEAGKNIGGLIGAILSIIDALGDDPSGFIKDLLDKIASVIEAIIEQIPQIVMSVVKGAADIVAGLGKGIINLFGLGGIFFGDNQPYEDALEKWQWVLDSWQDTIDYQRELMEKAYGVDAVKTMDEMRKTLERADTAVREIAKGWLTSGAGVFSSSNAYNVNEAIRWEYLSDELRKALGGDTVMNLFDLDWEQLEVLKRDNAQFWGTLHSEVQNYIDQIIEAGKAAEEAETMLMEKLTTTTEENMFDSFLDSLYNLADESDDVFDDIAGNWQKMVNKMLINNVVFDAQMQKNLKELYKRLSDAMNRRSLGGTNADFNAAIESIKSDYNDYVAQAQEKIEELRKAGLIMSEADVSSQEQSASVQAMERITTDQAEELIGRMNAGQMLWQHGNDQRALILQGLASMQEVVSGSGRSFSEMVTLMQTANSHLQSIYENNKKIYIEFGEKIDKMTREITNI